MIVNLALRNYFMKYYVLISHNVFLFCYFFYFIKTVFFKFKQNFYVLKTIFSSYFLSISKTWLPSSR